MTLTFDSKVIMAIQHLLCNIQSLCNNCANECKKLWSKIQILIYLTLYSKTFVVIFTLLAVIGPIMKSFYKTQEKLALNWY